MNDLIRKSDVIKLVNCFAFSLYKEQDDKIKKVFKEYIGKMPTAYSVDGVVNELEELKEEYLNYFVIHNKCIFSFILRLFVLLFQQDTV